MARQGKLSGSPFHVENMFYKYAIENESNDCRFPHKKPNCAYFKINGNAYSLFNSGFQTCAAYKCRYLQQVHRRDKTCNQCAYYFRKQCAHSKGKRTTDPSIASYCCFFNDNPEKVKQVQNSVTIVALRSEIEKCKTSIKRSKKYINEAEKELASPKVRADDLNYLRDKIASRQSRIQAFEKRLSLLSQELENAEKQAHK